MNTLTRSVRHLVIAVAVAATVGISAPPAVAGDEPRSSDSCASAPDSGEWTSYSGSVHNSWDRTDWYGHSSQANQRTITLNMSENLDLEVYPANCTTPLCVSSAPGTVQERCVVTVTGLIKIHIVWPMPAAGFGVANYTLGVELPPPCRDGYDNDGDNLADYPLDPDCTDPNDTDEAGAVPPPCSDRSDNDGDGRTDYPLDPGCTGSDDTSEENTSAPGCSPTAPGVVACLTPGGVVLSQPLALVSLEPTTSRAVVGYVGRYVFTLPLDIEVTLPCVAVTLGGSADPCAAAGGRFVDRIATLVDTTVSEYAVVPGPTVATVRVCNATLTATVLGLGVNSAPALTLC